MQNLSITSVETFLLETVNGVGSTVATVLTSTILLSLAIILLDFGYRTIVKGRTSFLSKHVSFLDHVPFTKPYKGYNRLRSKEWNYKHTM
jgi:hypothetical protein